MLWRERYLLLGLLQERHPRALVAPGVVAVAAPQSRTDRLLAVPLAAVAVTPARVAAGAVASLAEARSPLDPIPVFRQEASAVAVLPSVAAAAVGALAAEKNSDLKDPAQPILGGKFSSTS